MVKNLKMGLVAGVFAITGALTGTIITSYDAQAARNLSGSIMNNNSSDKAVGRCSSDYMMCTSNIGRLCKRLVRGGRGGGSIKNCTVRKDNRCTSRLNRCLGKV